MRKPQCRCGLREYEDTVCIRCGVEKCITKASGTVVPYVEGQPRGWDFHWEWLPGREPEPEVSQERQQCWRCLGSIHPDGEVCPEISTPHETCLYCGEHHGGKCAKAFTVGKPRGDSLTPAPDAKWQKAIKRHNDREPWITAIVEDTPIDEKTAEFLASATLDRVPRGELQAREHQAKFNKAIVKRYRRSLDLARAVIAEERLGPQPK